VNRLTYSYHYRFWVEQNAANGQLKYYLRGENGYQHPNNKAFSVYYVDIHTGAETLVTSGNSQSVGGYDFVLLFQLNLTVNLHLGQTYALKVVIDGYTMPLDSNTVTICRDGNHAPT
jgi:hypothetical protein